MKTIRETLGTPAQVGPQVIQKVFYGGLVGAGAAVYWWGFSIIPIGIGILGGAAIGSVIGIALVVFGAFAETMVSRRERAN